MIALHTFSMGAFNSTLWHPNFQQQQKKKNLLCSHIYSASPNQNTTWISLAVRTPTFLENMFCKEKQRVAARALISPERSKDSSVMVARSTPPIMGTRDRYTWRDGKESKYSPLCLGHAEHSVGLILLFPQTEGFTPRDKVHYYGLHFSNHCSFKETYQACQIITISCQWIWQLCVQCESSNKVQHILLRVNWTLGWHRSSQPHHVKSRVYVNGTHPFIGQSHRALYTFIKTMCKVLKGSTRWSPMVLGCYRKSAPRRRINRVVINCSNELIKSRVTTKTSRSRSSPGAG